MIRHRTYYQQMKRENMRVVRFARETQKYEDPLSPYPYVESMANGVTQALFGLMMGTGISEAVHGLMARSAFDLALKRMDCEDDEK